MFVFFQSLGAVDSRSLRFESNTRMKVFVRRSIEIDIEVEIVLQ
jgi:hypothetical protein